MKIENKEMNLKNPFIHEKFSEKFPWFDFYIEYEKRNKISIRKADINSIKLILRRGKVLFVPFRADYKNYPHLFEEYKCDGEIIYFKFFNNFEEEYRYFREFEWLFIIEEDDIVFKSTFFYESIYYETINIGIYKIDHEDIINKMKTIEFNASVKVNELDE